MTLPGSADSLDVSLSDEDLKIISGDDDADDDVDDKNEDRMIKRMKKRIRRIDEEGEDDRHADEDDEIVIDEDNEGEEDDEEDTEEDDDEDEDELVRVSYKDIKTKHEGRYKEFFKDFPGLKKAFFREQAYTEIFSNPSDAKDAAEAKESFNTVRDTVLSGNAEAFLKDVQNASPQGFKTFTSNFLNGLNKIDNSAFVEITAPVFKATLDQVYKLGKKNSNKNLENAARLVFSTVFSSDDDLVSGRATDNNKKDAPRDEEFNRERNEFYSQKYNGVQKSVSDTLNTKLTKLIDKGLDPTDSLKPGLKRLLIRDIAAGARLCTIVKDKAHMDRVNRLWRAEQSARFNGTNKDSIVMAYLSRAKALIPKIRSAKRKEYFDDQD